MNVAFRVDASNEIGTGHFIRCLALADALALRNNRIRFISRHLPPHFRAMLAANGHAFVALDSPAQAADADGPPHALWLGTSQERDAADSVAALSDHSWDWLVIDHYALDARWEARVRHSAKRIFAIDDLADRRHDCDVLLDQNPYIDRDARYDGKLPPHCIRLLGLQFALMRDAFRQAHEQVRERSGPVRCMLIFFGGVDADNYTAVAIDALTDLHAPDLQVDVVIGVQHPARAQIEAACTSRGYRCHVQTPDIAHLMAQADLAVGAGGTATWERCCLGLPTLTLCIAANQRKLIDDAARANLICAPTMSGDLKASMRHDLQILIDNPRLRTLISRQGLNAVDGHGVSRIVRIMETQPDSLG